MTLKGLLLKYNKVHNESLSEIAPILRKQFEISWHHIESDLLSYEKVEKQLDNLLPLDFLVIGDVFWPTGQNVCKWAITRKVASFFLQHGQWIYINNKKKLEHYPGATLFFGDNTKEMCSTWTYANYSKLEVVGNPRYVNSPNKEGSYVYFSPPVIEEILHNKPSNKIREPFLKCLQDISGIDKETPIVLQPHYREAQTDRLRELFPNAQFADPSLSTLKLVKGATKVITSRNSTVVLDAIAYEKKVVFTELPYSDACFFKKGYFGDFGHESETKNQFFKHVTQNDKINKTSYAEKAKKYIYLGSAAQRVVNLISRGIM